MPPKLIRKELEDILQAIQDRLTSIQSQMEANEARQSNLEARNDFLHSSITVLQDQVSTIPNPQSSPFISSHEHTTTVPPPLPPIRPPKLQLTFFEGPDPLDWLFQTEQYFNFYHISPKNRLSMVPFHMSGEALSWFKWMHQNHLITDWPSFTRSLELRFGPSSYPNHQAELFKLHQQTIVTDYQTRFEKLCNRVHGLSSETILNCFISGLNPEIQRELAILNPYSIPQAIGLVKLIEDKIKDSKLKPTRPPTYTTVLNPINTNINRPQSTQPTPHTLPIKRLSPTQMQKRRALGLCYNCDEKFLPGHKCSTSCFLLLLDDAEPVPEILHTPHDLDQTEDMVHFHLSPHALTRNFSPQTLKFQGLIHNLPVPVLIDSGSSHNILQPRIAKHLHLPIQPNPPFRVMVGNGAFITCQGIFPEVQIYLQNSVFTIPFYLLPIEGADVVLGIEWLRTLGPIQADFAIPSMAFTHLNKQITLTATNPPTPTQGTYHQLCHNISNHTITSLHLLSIDTHSMIPISLETSLQTPSSPLYQLPQSIQTILRKHKSIFKPPHGLPPPRPHDHHIPLLPKTGPVNVRPYKYPHS